MWERSLPAKNDDAVYLKKRGAPFAGKLRSHIGICDCRGYGVCQWPWLWPSQNGLRYAASVATP
ncbi:hypothetical protein GC387_00915 [Pseudomonas sp. MWU12-2323]|nr:hypothetical protein [Pseudomonas sp. MWU12-2323]RBH58548.1 hypothetical protein C3F00_007465 [Pseudomonas sp. MWU13-2860]